MFDIPASYLEQEKHYFSPRVWQNDCFTVIATTGKMYQHPSFTEVETAVFTKHKIPTYKFTYNDKNYIIPIAELVHRIFVLKDPQDLPCTVEYSIKVKNDVPKYNFRRFNFRKGFNGMNYEFKYPDKIFTPLKDVLEFIKTGKVFNINRKKILEGLDNDTIEENTVAMSAQELMKNKVSELAEQYSEKIVPNKQLNIATEEFINKLSREATMLGYSYLLGRASEAREYLTEKLMNAVDNDKAWAIKYLLSYIDGSKKSPFEPKKTIKEINAVDAIILNSKRE